MVCRMMKKGLIGAGLVAGTMVLLFGSKAWHYTRYAAHSVRETARASVPFDADVASARDQVKALEPAIHRGAEALAKLEYSIKELGGEVVALRSNLAAEERQIQALRSTLESGDLRRVGGLTASTREMGAEILRRLDTYKVAKTVLDAKEQTLKHREQQLKDAHEQLIRMKDRRLALLAKINEIEARHEVLEATRTLGEFDFQFDSGALAEAEKTVADLDKRVNIEDRTKQLQGMFAERTPAEPASGRDAIKEVDEVFGKGAKPASASADKDL